MKGPSNLEQVESEGPPPYIELDLLDVPQKERVPKRKTRTLK